MARSRLGEVASLISGFNAAYDTVGRVMRDDELAKIAAAKVEQVPGAFPAPAEGAVQAQLDSGAGVGEARQLAQGPRAAPTFNFLGQSYGSAPDEQAQTAARQLAMAGVFEKNAEVERGMGMRQAVRRDQIAQEGLGMERERFAWDKSDRAKREADDAARRKAEEETAAWWKARLTSQDGTQREPQPQDYLEATQHRIGMLAKAGRFDEAAKAFSEHAAQAMGTIHLDQAKRDESVRGAIAAAAQGNLQPAIDAYNRFFPDGSKATGYKVGKDGAISIERVGVDGSKLPPQVYKGGVNELVATLNTARDPMALWQYSQGEFRNHLEMLREQRAAAHEGKVGKVLDEQLKDIDEKRTDRKAFRDARVGVQQAIDSGDKAAETKARKELGLFAVGAKGASIQLSPEERRAIFYLASGAAKDEAEAARMSHEKVQPSIMDRYMEIAKPSGGLMPTEVEVERTMGNLFGSNWKDQLAAARPGAAAAKTFASEADAAAAAKAGKIKAGDRVIINGRSGTWR